MATQIRPSAMSLAQQLIAQMAADGVPYAEIVDALLVAGVKASLTVYGKERTLSILKTASIAVEGGHDIKEVKH